jgi:hypothetical protein
MTTMIDHLTIRWIWLSLKHRDTFRWWSGRFSTTVLFSQLGHDVYRKSIWCIVRFIVIRIALYLIIGQCTFVFTFQRAFDECWNRRRVWSSTRLRSRFYPSRYSTPLYKLQLSSCTLDIHIMYFQ